MPGAWVSLTWRGRTIATVIVNTTLFAFVLVSTLSHDSKALLVSTYVCTRVHISSSLPSSCLPIS
jgi:hypothetical protein